MQILKATQDDLAKIVEIYNQNITSKIATADLAPVSVSSKQDWFDKHTDTRPIYVIKETDEVVAWGSFSNFYDRKAYDITAEISIYVDKLVKNKGYGLKLLTFMLHMAPNLGIKNILAIVFSHNLASIKTFSSLGFTQYGLLPQVCDMQGFFADVLILGKNLEQ